MIRSSSPAATGTEYRASFVQNEGMVLFALRGVRAGGLGLLAGLLLACSKEPPTQSLIDASGQATWVVPYTGKGRVVAAGDLVFFPGDFHDVIAVRKNTGVVAWRSRTAIQSPNTIGWGVAVAGDVVVLPDAYLHAFDRSTGALRWTFTGDEGGLPAQAVPVGNSQLVFSGSGNGLVYGIRAADGVEVWRAAPPWNDGYLAMDPTLAGDTLFVGYAGYPGLRGGIAAFHASTGALIWARDFTPLVGPGQAARCLGNVVVDSATVYASTQIGDVIALDRNTGQIRWQRRPTGGGPANTRQLAIVRRVLVAATLEGQWHGLDAATGNLLWSTDGQLGSIMNPLAAHDGLVYAASGVLATIDPADGSTRILLRGNGASLNLFGTPAIDDERVYIGGQSLWAVRK